MRVKRTIITTIMGAAIGSGALVAPAAAAPVAAGQDAARTATTASVATPFTDPWDYWCLPSEVGQYKQWKDVTYRCQYVGGDGPYWVALS